jgi:CheY-like chemotaxis protein
MAKIVVVDDSKLARDVVGRAMEDAGHTVVTVDPISLFEVLKAVREFMPQVVITEYQLSRCNSESLVRTLREDPFLKDLKILALSSYHDAEAVSRMVERGVDSFLFKGDAATLVERIRYLLA